MARKLVTKRRADWASNRTGVVFKGAALRPSVTIQDRYYRQLMRIITEMTTYTEKQVNSLYTSRFSAQYYAEDVAIAMDASLAAQARILANMLERRFEKLFKEKGQRVAAAMVKANLKASKTGLHSSLQELSGGLSLKTDIMTGSLREMLAATVDENVSLIKTIAGTYTHNVRGIMTRAITEPAEKGLAGVISDLHKLLNEEAKKIKNKAKNLALDQTRKTYNNINKERMQAVGIRKFEWIHSGGGQEPRALHLYKLNGNVYSFDDLPIIDERTGERGIPGQAINCRCTMRPVLDLD